MKSDIGLQDLGEEHSERNEGSGGRHRPRSGDYLNFQILDEDGWFSRCINN
jgi:hypothetical protein